MFTDTHLLLPFALTICIPMSNYILFVKNICDNSVDQKDQRCQLSNPAKSTMKDHIVD